MLAVNSRATLALYFDAAGLDEKEAEHAFRSLDRVYGPEHVVQVKSGRQIRTPDAPSPCHYIRITLPDGTEIARWDAAEWHHDPETLGRVMACASSYVPLVDAIAARGRGNHLQVVTVAYSAGDELYGRSLLLVDAAPGDAALASKIRSVAQANCYWDARNPRMRYHVESIHHVLPPNRRDVSYRPYRDPEEQVPHYLRDHTGAGSGGNSAMPAPDC